MPSHSSSLTVRRIGPDGLEPMIRAVEAAFGEESTATSIASWTRILERDRTFAIEDGRSVVGGGAVHTFRLSVPGGTLPAGGLTAVGVLPGHRRRGGLTALIRTVLDDGIARGEPLSALWASEGPIYGRYGYGLATLRGTLTVPRHQVVFRPPAPEVARIRLLEVREALTALPPVWDRLARSTPGLFSRSAGWWEHEALDDAEWRRGGAGPRFLPAVEIDGQVVGYAFYRIRPEWDHLGSHGTLEVREVVAPDPAVELALWRFLLEMDLVSTIKAINVPVDTPLFHRVADPRRLAMTIGDGLWLRILDVAAALEGRSWAADDRLVLDVHDPLLPAVAGRWRLDASSGRAQVTRTSAEPDVTLDAAALASLYLGGIRAAELARAGRLEARDDSILGRLDALLVVGRRPWCPAVF